MSEQSATIVWLDPVERLGEIERERIAEAGLRPMPVRSISEAITLAPSAERVIVRAVDDTATIAELRKRIDALPNRRPLLVARVDRDCFELAVQAMRDGADNVIAADDFSTSVWRSTQKVHASVSHDAREKTYVFTDPRSQTLLALAQRVARSDISVLISGPTGVGKEVMARVLHESSSRSKAPFVALNCATLPESLIESILFGHEKGSFTGAGQSRAGLFEQANGGTLFLDEIGEMPYPLQSKLLRVLQERELTRLGSNQTIRLDFRLVAATNRDLRSAIAAREFREDLYFRVSAFRLAIPPLVERPGDILPLAALFLVKHSHGAHPPVLSPDAGEALLAYGWPGNVRELENVMQRALVLCNEGSVDAEHLVFDDPVDGGWAAQAAQGSMMNMASGAPAAAGGSAPTGVPVNGWASQAQAWGAQAAWGGLAAAAAGFPGAVSGHPAGSVGGPVSSFLGSSMPSSSHGASASPMLPIDEALESSVRATEYQAIMNAIRGTSNRNEAAARLGISPRTLRYKLARLRDPMPGGMVAIGEGAV